MIATITVQSHRMSTIQDHRFSLNSNTAGAPLPLIPRRLSSTSRPTLPSSPSLPIALRPSLSAPSVTTATATVTTVTPSTPKLEVDSSSSNSSTSDGSRPTVRIKRVRGVRAAPLYPSELSAPIPITAGSATIESRTSSASSQSSSSTDSSSQAGPSKHMVYSPGMSLRLSVDALRARNVSGSNVSGSTAASGSKSTSALCETFGEAKLIRKKSGQLVKPSLKTSRSASRNGLSVVTLPLASKSEPTTPTSKAVHFDAKLEHVKLFLAEQKPLAVSRDGSPTDDTSGTDSDFPGFIYGGDGDERRPKRKLVMQVANMPVRVCPDSDVALEELSLSADGTNIVGRVRVRNIAYAKWVAVRFTFDSWQTTSEVMGKYIESLGPAFDRFGFTIRLNDLLARIEGKTLIMAIRYSVADREFWDNNNGHNYCATFTKTKISQERRSVSVSDDEASADMADLRSKLEKVASVSDSRTGPAFSSQHARKQSFTSSPDTAFRTSPSLASRYDFANSLKAPWKPSSPPLHARTNSFPLSSAKSSTSPSWSHKGPADPYTPKHTKSKPALGSPRDVEEEILAAVQRKTSFEAEDAASFKSHRHHQRGYFDLSVPPAELKKTPTGTPLVASPNSYSSPSTPIPFPVVDGQVKREFNEDDSALSTPSMVTPSSSRSSTPSPMMFTSMGVSADPGSEVQSPETHYRQFLNKFCFFTGPESVIDSHSDPIQRAHSASEVEELLTGVSPRLASTPHAASTIRSASLESVVSRSGSITPTISRIHLEPTPVRP
ncbi:hypothetical protein CVT24_003807 [Panaeolus cyanescens]|uniref:CBM21 domain-containing protein n=1 Tax=Panaeolus cyanescens TaxID=181874 RepID=A0A409VUZ4_9AGAR|nr:hypothetical protein CVT24_003807 [Panaeolus cyanescens]